MKKLFLFFPLLVFISCSKDDDSNNAEPENTRTEFIISAVGSINKFMTCNENVFGTDWHDGEGEYPQIGDTIYLCESCDSTSPGEGSVWRKIGNNTLIKIGDLGVVIEIENCD